MYPKYHSASYYGDPPPHHPLPPQKKNSTYICVCPFFRSIVPVGSLGFDKILPELLCQGGCRKCGFPKTRGYGTCMGGSSITVFWGLYLGSSIYGNSQILHLPGYKSYRVVQGFLHPHFLCLQSWDTMLGLCNKAGSLHNAPHITRTGAARAMPSCKRGCDAVGLGKGPSVC